MVGQALLRVNSPPLGPRDSVHPTARAHSMAMTPARRRWAAGMLLLGIPVALSLLWLGLTAQAALAPFLARLQEEREALRELEASQQEQQAVSMALNTAAEQQVQHAVQQQVQEAVFHAVQQAGQQAGPRRQQQQQQYQQTLASRRHRREASDDPVVPVVYPEQLKALRPTAMCLVGAARDLDMTAPGLAQHLLRTYADSHLFLHSPFDETSAKLAALTDALDDLDPAYQGGAGGAPAPGRAPLLHTVRVVPMIWINESEHPTHVLKAKGSPNGAQGLLQYFALVEGCLTLIREAEAAAAPEEDASASTGPTGGRTPAKGPQYEWVVRSRVDAFWHRPPPALEGLERGGYTVPYGNNWAGLNDRLGIGGRQSSEVGLSRLSLLHAMARKGLKELTSEKAFAAQFSLGRLPRPAEGGAPLANRVAVHQANFSFCVLSRRPLRIKQEVVGPSCDHSMMFSLASTAPLNGAKCLPCRSCAPARKIESYLSRLSPRAYNWPGPFAQGMVLCTPEWPQDWQQVYRSVVGYGTVSQQKRTLATASDMAACVPSLEKLKSKAGVWDAPSPVALCTRAQLGKAEILGVPPEEEFYVYPSRLTENSVVLAEDGPPGLSPGAEGGTWDEALVARVPGIQVQRMTAPHFALWKTRQVDVLKVAVASPVSDFLRQWFGGNEGSPRICQLLVSLPVPWAERSSRRELVSSLLAQYNFQLDGCILRPSSDAYRCTFFSLEHCLDS